MDPLGRGTNGGASCNRSARVVRVVVEGLCVVEEPRAGKRRVGFCATAVSRVPGRQINAQGTLRHPKTRICAGQIVGSDRHPIAEGTVAPPKSVAGGSAAASHGGTVLLSKSP